ncbi:hypothetical protein V7183_10090 [Bacillus sp. JJ1127]|uniref:hypothetical protein n=1 Tax=Bacillus sp. JJ1127 TaxID=3122952 RepID=UPI002FFED5D0
MEQEVKEKLRKSVVMAVGRAWNNLKNIIHGVAKDIEKTARTMQPVVKEIQRVEKQLTKFRRQVTYRKKKSQAKRKAWKKYSL